MMQSLVKFRNKKKGFTLVELIVVIAIIGILAAVLLPKYFGFTDNARQSNALSEAKGIRAIYETMFAKSTDGKWPTTFPTSTDANAKTSTITDPDTSNSNTFPGIITAPEPSTVTTPDGSFKYVSNNGWIVRCTKEGVLTASKT